MNVNFNYQILQIKMCVRMKIFWGCIILPTRSNIGNLGTIAIVQTSAVQTLAAKGHKGKSFSGCRGADKYVGLYAPINIIVCVCMCECRFNIIILTCRPHKAAAAPRCRM